MKPFIMIALALAMFIGGQWVYDSWKETDEACQIVASAAHVKGELYSRFRANPDWEQMYLTCRLWGYDL